MFNKQLMSPQTSVQFEELGKTLKMILEEHKKFSAKAKAKTLTAEENELWKKYREAYLAIEKTMKQMWDDHSLIKHLIEKKD